MTPTVRSSTAARWLACTCGVALLLGACGGSNSDTVALPETRSIEDPDAPAAIDVTALAEPTETDGECITAYRAHDGLYDEAGRHVLIVLTLADDPADSVELLAVLSQPACPDEIVAARDQAASILGVDLHASPETPDGDPPIVADLAFSTPSGRYLVLPE